MRKIIHIFLLCFITSFGISEASIHIDSTRKHKLEPSNCIEGFAYAIYGQQFAYHCHSSNNSNARIVRASGGKISMRWKTADVPKSFDGDYATFYWTCGLGCNLGNKKFDLYVNNRHRFTFLTLSDKRWKIAGIDDGELAFDAVMSDQNSDLFGFMHMNAPASWLTPGKPIEIKIVGHAEKSPAWVMTFERTDTLKTLRKVYLSQLVFHDSGAIRVDFLAGPQLAGKTITLASSQNFIGQGILQLDGNISMANISIPREKRFTSKKPLHVFVEDDKCDINIDIGEMNAKAFLEEDLHFDRYVFPPGVFPKVNWKRPGKVSNELGDFDLKVTFYDKDMQPVGSPEKTGRYGAVVEGDTPDGYHIRRYITLFCCPEDFQWWDNKIPVSIGTFKSFGINNKIWRTHQDTVDKYYSDFILRQVKNDPKSAIFLAGMSELETIRDNKAYKNNPFYRDYQWWVTFKRHQLRCENKYPLLNRPIKIQKQKATSLQKGDAALVGYNKEHIAEIRKVCQEWAEVAKEPLVTLVARKGIIIFHEAFGRTNEAKNMTLETSASMASITKLLTGCLMMQFVDQGLIDLDDPVKKYLSEFECETQTPLTIRHLFTHTNGFEGYGFWASDENPSLENCIGYYLPYLKVGKKHAYNGVGYAVAGKVMERISGKCIPYLFQENLFEPLGAQNTKVAGTSGDAESICLDMAKVGQMLLNRGSYDQYSFFSEENYKKMLPIKLDKLVPGLEQEWGIGVVWSGGNGLSKKTIGHGALSGAILLIDPTHELVIVSCRNRMGAKYTEYSSRLIKACVAPFQNQ